MVRVFPVLENVCAGEVTASKLIMSPTAAVFELPPIAEPASRMDNTKSVFDFAPKVSFDAAVTITCPELFEFTTNCLRTLTDVTETFSFESVLSVLILFFLNFLIRRFLVWSISLARCLTAGTVVTAVAEFVPRTTVVSLVIVFTFAIKSAPPAPAPVTLTISPTRSSVVKSVPKPLRFAFEPFIDTEPDNENSASRTVSAVKFSAGASSASAINTCLTLSKVFVVTAETVRGLLLASSRNKFALFPEVCEVEIRFSPTLKLPDTVIS